MALEMGISCALSSLYQPPQHLQYMMTEEELNAVPSTLVRAITAVAETLRIPELLPRTPSTAKGLAHLPPPMSPALLLLPPQLSPLRVLGAPRPPLLLLSTRRHREEHAHDELCEATADARAAGERSVTFFDNLSGQTTKEHKRACNYAGSDRHLLPMGTTGELMLIDGGIGARLKELMGEEQDAWLEEEGNLERWTTGPNEGGLKACAGDFVSRAPRPSGPSGGRRARPPCPQRA